ncbi:MAG: glycosyltransferase [uncultured bacterium]|nr:MAG: glycosyltransferase [uncultured bacterium]KKQ45191.1 MAG: Glycosyltransferase [Candidatus Moranbacteria bacterium GW2011_GWC2_37_8]
MENKFSIIVCTFNRLDYLKKCINALLALDFPEYKILIVNDGSTNETKNFLDALNEKRITVIHNETNKGLSRSRNIGIANSTSEFLAFTDDDCQVDKNWLAELSKSFDKQKVDFVIGQTFYISASYKGYFPERLVSNIDARWPMGCNIAYRKKVFEICGGFDDFFYKYNNEDSEMAIRATSKNFSFARCKTAIVNHQAMNWNAKALLRSTRNAAVWPLLKKKYPEYFQVFGSPVLLGTIINPKDYLFLLILPVVVPVLFIRYLAHGKRDVKIFFIKWPVYLILRRYYIYKEAISNKIFMF